MGDIGSGACVDRPRMRIMTPVVSIPANQVSFHPMSFCDHSGRLFSWDRKLYRAITAQGEAPSRSLFERHAVDRLVGKGLLVGTELTDLRLEGYSLIVRHDR